MKTLVIILAVLIFALATEGYADIIIDDANKPTGSKCMETCDNTSFDYLSSYSVSDDGTVMGIVKKTTWLLKNVALILGVGLGNIFCLIGMAKIRRKEEDPREFSKGVTYFVVGIGCIMLSTIIKGILDTISPSASVVYESIPVIF